MNGRRRIYQRLHDAPGFLNAVLAGEAARFARSWRPEQHLVVGFFRCIGGISMSKLIGSAPRSPGTTALGTSRIPAAGSSLTMIWSGSGWRSIRRANSRRGGCLKTSRTSVCMSQAGTCRCGYRGTPDHRQLSMSRRKAQYVSVLESFATPSIARGSLRTDHEYSGPDQPCLSPVNRELRVLDRLQDRRQRGLHGGGRNDLHQVVHDHVLVRQCWIVKVPTVLDSEVLGHRNLHALNVVQVPDGFEHRVSEGRR